MPSVAIEAVPTYRGTRAGKEFEKDILERLNAERELGRVDAGRYGVQVAITGSDPKTGQPNVRPIRSYPDIEGALPGGRQFIFDAKVESSAKFDLHRYRLEEGMVSAKARQLRHMLGRSRMNVITFFTIHWNARELKTKSEPPETFVFPVRHDCPFWLAFFAQEVKAIRRDDCREYGLPVEWNRMTTNERKFRPDLLAVINRLARASDLKPGGWDPMG